MSSSFLCRCKRNIEQVQQFSMHLSTVDCQRKRLSERCWTTRRAELYAKSRGADESTYLNFCHIPTLYMAKASSWLLNNPNHSLWLELLYGVSAALIMFQRHMKQWLREDLIGTGV